MAVGARDRLRDPVENDVSSCVMKDQMAPKKPAFKSAAISCFTITAAVIGYVIYRNSQ